MLDFDGAITLVQISDGVSGAPGTPGKGIKKIDVFYAVSSNGIQPPADKMVDYAIKENVLTSSDPVNTFRIDSSGVLYFIREKEDRIGVVDKEEILKIEDGTWTNTPPAITDGSYLWTKTITTYSDDEVVVTYYAGKVGKDGASFYTWIKYADDDQGKNMSDDPEGKAYIGIAYNKKESTESTNYTDYTWSLIKGEKAISYYIETNQEEILRFKEGKGYLYSPQTFTFKIYNNPKQDSDKQIIISDDSYKLEYYNENGFQEIEKNEPKNDPILERGASEEADSNTVYFSVFSFYNNQTEKIQNNQIFRFSYLIDGQVAATKIFQMRDGITEDMATFGLYAGGFNAAIQETKLDFSSAGLSIMNGGIKIFKKHQYSFFETKDITMQDNKDYYEKNEESENEIYFLTADTIFQSGKKYYERGKENTPSFWADTNGNLTLTGTIYATDGSFSGSLYSTNAKIGGFTIDDSQIYAPARKADGTNETTSNGSPLILNSNGSIYAKNITIGTDAVIEQFISLGNAKILNPNHPENNGLILSAGKMSLKQDGHLSLGEIEFFGGNGSYNSYIKCEPSGAFANWQINGDGTAYFNEITVNKATIQNSVLEIGTVQSVGSLMLFKDGWKVESVQDNGYKLNSIHSLQKDDYIIVSKEGKIQYYKILEVFDDGIISLKSGILSVGDVITKLGKNQDYLISILGETTNKFDFSSGNSLTISQASIDDNKERISFNKRLVLGDLSGINYSGFGLYADNVYLKGTLTTEVAQNSYAGMNTLSGTNAIKFGKTDETKIVFWAGAENNTKESIQASKFQVTEQGSIYASQGIFEGAIISKSTIKGASLHAAKIYGENLDGSSAALEIYDCAKGIQFMKARGESTIQLQIDSAGFSKDKIHFINLTDTNKINFLGTGSKYRDLNSNSGSCSSIDSNSLSFGIINGEEYSSNWEIQNNNINSTLQFLNINSKIFELADQEVRSYQNFYADNNITFGEKMEYRKVLDNDNVIGYNLYVR